MSELRNTFLACERRLNIKVPRRSNGVCGYFINKIDRKNRRIYGKFSASRLPMTERTYIGNRDKRLLLQTGMDRETGRRNFTSFMQSDEVCHSFTGNATISRNTLTAVSTLVTSLINMLRLPFCSRKSQRRVYFII